MNTPLFGLQKKTSSLLCIGTLTAALTLLSTSNSYAFSKAKSCTLSYSPADLKVEWTAFKTTAKVAVSGTFKEVAVKGPSQGGSVEELLKNSQVEINGKSIHSGNEGRDMNIREAFLAKLAKDAAFKGTFSGITSSGFTLMLDFNGMQREVPMTYSTKDGVFVATGGFDLLDFKANAAYDGIHERCKELHKGADGVSKTWSEIQLKIQAPFKDSCKS